MSIKAQCACGKRFKAKDEYAGRTAVCPECRREFRFPALAIPEPAHAPVRVPLPMPQTEPKSDASADGTESARSVWKNPIVVVAALVPAFVATVYFGYLAWQGAQAHQRREDGNQDAIRHSGRSDSVKADVDGRGARGGMVSSGATTPTRNPKIPVEVSYPVMDEKLKPPYHRIVSIAINMKVPKEILREIALELKAKEIEQYESTFVYFYLPPYWDGKDSWAHAFFSPTLEVEILGLEEGKERVLAGLRVILPENSTLIGSWISQENPTSSLSTKRVANII
jgi:hypothetical protein